jgi:CheY-like chemotaxis protein
MLKHHTLRVDPLGESIVVEVDPVRLTQVITNLLTNAAKYTPAGGVISLGTEVGAQFLTIYVRDNGVGLSSDEMRDVFTMFTRIDSETARAEGGLGYRAGARKGLGATSWRTHRCQECRRGFGQRIHGLHRILLADDNRDAAESLSMLLTLYDHEVHVANSGFEAFEAFEAAKTLRPDVCIFDIGMPDFNGYELAERIRHEAWGTGMTLIALTGWGQESDKRRAALAGLDHHLTKPVDPARLEECLEVNS